MSKIDFTWQNGTLTELESGVNTVVIRDVSERLTGGETENSYTLDGALALADEHERFAQSVRRAVNAAVRNTPTGEDD